jgi:hypothetical protein
MEGVEVREEGLDVSAFETVEAIDEAIKSLRDRRKEVKAEATKADREAAKVAKAEALAEAKATLEAEGLEEGDTIRAILKGEEVLGEFVKETEARFVILVDGEKKTLPFDKFVGRAADEVEGDVDEEVAL